jgi:hypothetical protein
MKKRKKQKKSWRWLLLTLIVGIGTYNAVVINTHSHLTSKTAAFEAELDELPTGRIVAQETRWKKISQEEIAQTASQVSLAEMEMPKVAPAAEAAIKDELNLELIEVSNPKKWKAGLSRSEFEGSLSTSDGVINSFEVSLPSGEMVSVEFVEMNGNVFHYDLDGQIYNAMIFQADQHTYMVSFSDGPLEGTRLRFSSPATEEQLAIQQELSENHNVEVGNFGVAQPEAEPTREAEVVEFQSVQAQSFNMNQQVL